MGFAAGPGGEAHVKIGEHYYLYFWVAPGRTTLQTACRYDSSVRIFRITHPFHPFRGRDFAFESVVSQRGEERVILSDPNGYPMGVPIRFTDIIPPDPYVAIGHSRSFFRVQDLVKLSQLVKALEKTKRRRSRKAHE